MGVADNIVAFVLLFCIIAYLLYVLHYIIDLYVLSVFKTTVKLSDEEEQLIISNVPAYSFLSLKQKQKFKRRVSRFRANKVFVFAEKSSKEEEIKLLFSAMAVLLTLGYKDYRIASINKILIYPSSYFSLLTKKNHLGEYNPRLNLLVFSAEHILKGFKDPTDNLNLGVHEFAHALVFNFRKRITYHGFIFNKGLAKMKQLLKNEMFLNRMKETTYFREYATTNLHEFFSVVLENYVETPSEFEKLFPELYQIIIQMLNFDVYKSHAKM